MKQDLEWRRSIQVSVDSSRQNTEEQHGKKILLHQFIAIVRQHEIKDVVQDSIFYCIYALQEHFKNIKALELDQ